MLQRKVENQTLNKICIYVRYLYHFVSGIADSEQTATSKTTGVPIAVQKIDFRFSYSSYLYHGLKYL